MRQYDDLTGGQKLPARGYRRTISGRIVYERKLHRFTWADVARIVLHLSGFEDDFDKIRKWLGDIWNGLSDLMDRFVYLGNFFSTPSRIRWQLKAWAREIIYKLWQTDDLNDDKREAIDRALHWLDMI